MSKNKITDELISEQMLKLGYDDTKFHDEEYIQDKVLEHYEATITDEWKDRMDFYMYEESTSDGYSVFIATHDPANININDDVNYYDSEFSTILVEVIECGNNEPEIYIDSPSERWVGDAMSQLFEGICENIEQIAINNLIDLGYDEE
jgi:hypothetical protein